MATLDIASLEGAGEAREISLTEEESNFQKNVLVFLEDLEALEEKSALDRESWHHRATSSHDLAALGGDSTGQSKQLRNFGILLCHVRLDSTTFCSLLLRATYLSRECIRRAFSQMEGRNHPFLGTLLSTSSPFHIR